MPKPGIYDAISDEIYHKDPALSSTGARKLLGPESCPALFRHWFLSGEDTSEAFDRGHAAHTQVLGVGKNIAVSPHDEWRSNEAKAWVKAARLAGDVPMKAKDAEHVMAMAAALKADPVCNALLDPATGSAEQSFWWEDDHRGITCRGRTDWLQTKNRATGRAFPGGMVRVIDYKTTTKVDLVSIAKTVANYGYAQQARWYTRGLIQLGLAKSVQFIHIFQMITPPYLPSVVMVPDEWFDYADLRNAEALDVFADCIKADEWPTFTPAVRKLVMPWSEVRAYEDYIS